MASPQLDGMGTTLVAVRAINSSKLQVASVGDSRIYLLSNGNFSLLTQDQTWVAEVGARLAFARRRCGATRCATF